MSRASTTSSTSTTRWSSTTSRPTSTTSSLVINLSLGAVDPLSGVDRFRLQNDGGTWSPWMAPVASMPWNLTDFGGTNATGTRTVAMEVRDLAGNVGQATDDIYYFVPTTYIGQACAGSLGLPTFQVNGMPQLGGNVSFVPGNT